MYNDHKSLFSNLDFFATWWRKPFIFQTLTTLPSITHSLTYQRSTTSARLQLYRDWKVCICDDCATPLEIEMKQTWGCFPDWVSLLLFYYFLFFQTQKKQKKSWPLNKMLSYKFQRRRHLWQIWPLTSWNL